MCVFENNKLFFEKKKFLILKTHRASTVESAAAAVMLEINPN